MEEIRRRHEDHPELSYRSFAVLYRTNAQARAMEDAFRRQGIPYQVIGSVRFYERREIQDVLAYLRLISNPQDAIAFGRVVNYPRRGVGQTSRERLAAWARQEGITLLEAAARAGEAPGMRPAAAKGLARFANLIQRYSARAAQVRVGELLDDLVEELDLMRRLQEEGPDGEDRARNVAELIAGAADFNAELIESLEDSEVDPFTELDLFLQQVVLVAEVDRMDPDADTVTLMTLHNAKGLEFPVVFIAGMEEGLFPLSRAYDSPGAIEEERRLFYVGITRAEDKLNLLWARRRRRGGDWAHGHLSSFVDAIPEKLLERRRSERLRLRERAMRSYPRGSEGRTTAADGSDAGRTAELDDATLNQDLPRFVAGERVVHQTFGSGSVVDISGFGRDLRVTIDFDSVGRKRLLARYAHLEKDWP